MFQCRRGISFQTLSLGPSDEITSLAGKVLQDCFLLFIPMAVFVL